MLARVLTSAFAGAPPAKYKQRLTRLRISFEIYPPRRPEDHEGLKESILELAKLEPEFISVTFGAGGSSTKNSLAVLEFIKNFTASRPLAHLTCVGTTKTEAAKTISQFQEQGISDFLALRGDLPVGESALPAGSLSQADQLVALLDAMRDGDSIIAVAAFPNGHPESVKERQDIDALLSKQEKGADFAISQLFFETDDFLRFLELARSRGASIPIVPGIMPIVSPQRLERVVELSGECRPEELSRELNNAHSHEEQREIGIDWAARQVRELEAAGLDAVHLYAFNNHANAIEVLRRAGVV